MKVIIRADASVSIGSGHIMRCLTIAHKLKSEGCSVTFWMEPLEGHLIDFVEKQGFKNIYQAERADLYIIDHYEINREWEQSIKTYTKKIVVIDDLAREHVCDLVLDQNIIPNYEKRYEKKVPSFCKQLLGPKYLIMRDEFITARSNMKQTDTTVRNLLIFMGGADPTNETMKVLQALAHYDFPKVDVVVGNSNPLKKEIEQICKERNYTFHCQIDYMANLMTNADFALGAGGATMWERCYVGLPSSATIVADNQRGTTEFASTLGVVHNLGWYEQVTDETYKQLLVNLETGNMSEAGLTLTESPLPNAWLHEMLELIK